MGYFVLASVLTEDINLVMTWRRIEQSWAMLSRVVLNWIPMFWWW